MKASYFIIVLLFSAIIVSCTRRSNNFSGTSNGTSNHIQTPHVEQHRTSRQSAAKPRSSKMTGEEVFDRYNSAVFMVYTSDGVNQFQGSGFFIDQYGLAVSNYHVFEGTGMGLEVVKLSNGSKYKVREVVVKSREDDYIIFRVAITGNCNYIPISSRQKKVGEKVFAIGSPRGLENTFSSGEISQLRGDHIIQINAPIDHGSNGGALINEYGEVIGITSAGLDNSGANLNFAVDIEVLKPHLQIGL